MTASFNLSNNQNRMLAQEFSTMDEKELRALAKAQTAHDFKDSKLNKAVYTSASMFPLADSFAHATIANGSLGNKVSAGTSRLGDWGSFIGATIIFDKINKKIDEKFPKFKEFKERHPLMSGVVGLAGALTAGMCGSKAYNKIKNTFLSQEGVAKFEASIDKLPFAKKINEKVLTPLGKVFGSKFGGIALLATMAGIIGKTIYDVVSFNSKVDKNYEKLKEAQLEVIDSLEV